MAKKEQEKAHALLSPSGAARWMICTPSAVLESQFPDKTSDAAEEGTLAHLLGETIIRNRLGRVSDKAFADAMVNIKKHKFYSPEMLDYMNAYADFVLDELTASRVICPDAEIEVEVQLNLSDYMQDAFGTGDIGIVSDKVLKVIDLKYGKGVKVSCVDNIQMKIYALGFLAIYDIAYDIEEVQMTIYQPRMDNISSYTMKVKDLRDWAENELKPKAKLAFDGLGEYVPSDKCQFCKAKNRCRALAMKNLEALKYEFQDPDLLSDKEITEILTYTDMLVSWANSISGYALQEALNGKKWEGFKLVEGRSVRVITDDEKAAEILSKEGFTDEQIFTRKLAGITSLEKLVSKAKFNELLAGLIDKPQGKPTLVPECDSRPEFNGIEQAKADFQ
ncbi:DUF2800 domain-containing protein [Bacteroides sedimenti]|uniref:DUF2800 domain-containing protein n=1 Tax=Bacteroides sedimenti TaxID=2136147 RepID=A0ABN6Z0J8_9BACE